MTEKNNFMQEVTSAFTPRGGKKGAQEDENAIPPSPLCQHIKEQYWDEVRKDLGDDNRDSAVEMAGIWYEDDLPLHLACRNQVPADVIATLIDVYPQAVKQRSKKDNRLPLVICVKNKGSYNAVGRLIRAWPEALDQKIDDKSLVDTSTIRSDFSQWGVSGPIKKMVQRSTDHWKVVVEWEEEQKQYGHRVGSLEDKLKADEGRIDLAEKKDRALLKLIRDLETKHDNKVKELEAKHEASIAKIEALTKALDEFQMAQNSKNVELKNDIEMGVSREVVSRQAFKGYTDDLLKMYERSAKASEDLQKQVASIKINQTLQQNLG